MPPEKLAEVSIWSKKYPDKSNTICVQLDLRRTLSFRLLAESRANFLTSIKHVKREKKPTTFFPIEIQNSYLPAAKMKMRE